MTMDVNEMNRGIVSEFRANAGKVDDPFEGAGIQLLHTVGAKSGACRVNPLRYRNLGAVGWAVFGSSGGPVTPPGCITCWRTAIRPSIVCTEGR